MKYLQNYEKLPLQLSLSNKLKAIYHLGGDLIPPSYRIYDFRALLDKKHADNVFGQ